MGKFTLALLLTLLSSACRQPSPAPAATASNAAAEAYAPGLGEIMTLQQMRHTKLWLAGEAGNWDLAAYEIKELGEGFDDVVKFHPTHEESPVAPKDAIPRMVTVPLMDLGAAVGKKDTSGDEFWLQRRAAPGDESVSQSGLCASPQMNGRR